MRQLHGSRLRPRLDGWKHNVFTIALFQKGRAMSTPKLARAGVGGSVDRRIGESVGRGGFPAWTHHVMAISRPRIRPKQARQPRTHPGGGFASVPMEPKAGQASGGSETRILGTRAPLPAHRRHRILLVPIGLGLSSHHASGGPPAATRQERASGTSFVLVARVGSRCGWPLPIARNELTCWRRGHILSTL